MTRRSSTTIISNSQLTEMLFRLSLDNPVATESCERVVMARLDAETIFRCLAPADRLIFGLLSGYRIPSDYKGVMPPTVWSAGRYVGIKERGKPFSPRTIRQRRVDIRRRLHGLVE